MVWASLGVLSKWLARAKPKERPTAGSLETGPRDLVNTRNMGRMCNMRDSENCIRNGIAEAKRDGRR